MKGKSIGIFVWVPIMAVAVIAMLIDATTLPSSLREMPDLVGWTVLFLLAMVLVGEIYPKAIAWMDSPLEEFLEGGEANKEGPGGVPDVSLENGATNAVTWPAVLRILTYIIGFWALTFLFGLYLMPPLFIVFFLVVEAGVYLRSAILSALIACTILFVGLHLLQIDLWVGVVPEIVPGIVGGAVMPSL